MQSKDDGENDSEKLYLSVTEVCVSDIWVGEGTKSHGGEFVELIR